MDGYCTDWLIYCVVDILYKFLMEYATTIYKNHTNNFKHYTEIQITKEEYYYYKIYNNQTGTFKCYTETNN